MNEKRINARFAPKGDIEANWKKATGFVPLDKEVIIYKPDEDHSYSRMKIGDGITEINDLPFLAAQDSLPVAYINDDGELIFELGKGIIDAYINQQGELEIKVETEEGEMPLVLGKVKGRTPELRLTEKILEIKYDDETVWNTLVDFSTIASSFDLRLNEETYFLEAQREVDGEWESMVDLSALKLAHEHSNKDILDKITSSVFEQVKDAISKRHKHENANALNQITDEHIENIDKIPEIEEDVAELVNNPTKQLVEGIFYTDENKKGFSANKNAVPTADSVWIEGEASPIRSLVFDKLQTTATLNVVTTSNLKSSTTTVTIDIVNLEGSSADGWADSLRKGHHTGIIFEDTPDKLFFINISSVKLSGVTVSVSFTFIDGQETFPIEGNFARAIKSMLLYPRNGVGSHMEGLGTVAGSAYSHVQGKYNEIDTEGKYAHIVGNGTGEDNRSNAHTLDWEGNAWYAGEVDAEVMRTKALNTGIIDSPEGFIKFKKPIDTKSIETDDMLVGIWENAVREVKSSGTIAPGTIKDLGSWDILLGEWYIVTIGGIEYKLKCITEGVLGSREELGFYIYRASITSSSFYTALFYDNTNLDTVDYIVEKVEPNKVDILSYIDEIKAKTETLEGELANTGLTEEQAADLAANTEARHEHKNKDVLDKITEQTLTDIGTNKEAIETLTSDSKTEGSVEYKIAQAVAAIMENPDDTMNSIQELVTWCNEHAEDAIALNNQVMANKEASHVHENKDVLDTITNDKFLTASQKLAIDNDTVPLVTELPTDAKFGDLCRYSRSNELSIDDGGKTIYINKNWLAEAEANLTSGKSWVSRIYGNGVDFMIDVNMAAVDVFIVQILASNYSYTLCYRIDAAGNLSLITNNSSYPNRYVDSTGKSTTITNLPDSIQIPSGDYTMRNNPVNMPFTLFYHEPKLMIYFGDWVELPSKAEVEALSEAQHTHENRDVLDTITADKLLTTEMTETISETSSKVGTLEHKVNLIDESVIELADVVNGIGGLVETQHVHNNVELLENFTENENGELLYKGESIGSGSSSGSSSNIAISVEGEKLMLSASLIDELETMIDESGVLDE